MQPLFTFSEFSVVELTPDLVEKYAQEIIEALNQIPLVDAHTKEYLLAMTKGERVLHAKWQHSLIAIDHEKQFAGIIIGYERESEGNAQYPTNSLYLSDFAVTKKYQRKGLGKFLFQSWLEFNNRKGFIELSGPFRFSLQTNSAEFNKPVQKLYELAGFQKVSTKTYDNRVDTVYWLSPI